MFCLTFETCRDFQLLITRVRTRETKMTKKTSYIFLEKQCLVICVVWCFKYVLKKNLAYSQRAEVTSSRPKSTVMVWRAIDRRQEFIRRAWERILALFGRTEEEGSHWWLLLLLLWTFRFLPWYPTPDFYL